MMANETDPVRLTAVLIQAIAEDAETLAILHDRELTAEFLGILKRLDFPHNLGILPQHEATGEIWEMMATAVRELPEHPSLPVLDVLAVDYAAIYLTGACGASPYESAWLDDEHLLCQESMFQLREIYAAAGLKTVNWRQRPDDHLVLQLLYIAHAVRKAQHEADWDALARMMDEHLLRWLPDFSARVAGRSAQAFYGLLALLTQGWCDQLRDLIAGHLGRSRPTPAEIEERLCVSRPAVTVPLTYMPGAAPGW